jgi:hypothetical protein
MKIAVFFRHPTSEYTIRGVPFEEGATILWNLAEGSEETAARSGLPACDL